MFDFMTHRDFLDGTPMLSKEERINYMRKVTGCWVQDQHHTHCPHENWNCMDCVFATLQK